MVKITIKKKFPVISREFTASYSEVRKPTGVEYMLLTIIGAPSMRKMTWGEVMEILGIPEDVFMTVFVPAIEKMADSVDGNMLTLSDYVSLDGRVSVAEFTKSGRQAFEQGVIADHFDTFQGAVSNIPAALDRPYVPEKSVMNTFCSKDGFDLDRFESIETDDQLIENCIINEKTKFSVPADADVFDVKIAKESVCNCCERDIRLTLNEVSGNFQLEAGGLDDRFLKHWFSAGELLSAIPPTTYAFPTGDIKFEKWGSELPGWEKYSTILPADLNLRASKLVVVDGKSVRSTKYRAFDGELGCNMVSVETSTLGYEYSLIERDVSIDGFEGAGKCRFILRRAMSPEKIAFIVKSVAHSQNTDTFQGFKTALDIITILGNSDSTLEFVTAYLSSTSNLESDLKALGEFRKASWYSSLPAAVEEVIRKRGLSAEEAGKLLSATKTQISGRALVAYYRSDDPSRNLLVADHLYGKVLKNEILFEVLGISDYLCKGILNGTLGDFVSNPLAAASNMSKILPATKDALGVRSPSDYSIDIESLSSEERKVLIQNIKTFKNDLGMISKYLSHADGFRELKFYSDLGDRFLPLMKILEGEMAAEKGDDRSFGILLGIKLDNILSTMVEHGTLDEMIGDAFEQGFITKTQYEGLDDFRRFRNLCAHELEIPKLKGSERKKWTELVNELKVAPSGGEKE